MTVKIQTDICVKKSTFGILLHKVVKGANIKEVLLTIQCSYVMKLQKKQKALQQKLFQQKQFYQKGLQQIYIFYSPFY